MEKIRMKEAELVVGGTAASFCLLTGVLSYASLKIKALAKLGIPIYFSLKTLVPEILIVK